MPFFVMGTIQFILFIIAFYAFPSIHSIPPDSNTPVSRTLPMMNLLKIPKFVCTLLMLLIGTISNGFLEPSTQLHLEPVCLNFNFTS
jgi:hypothetical protein